MSELPGGWEWSTIGGLLASGFFADGDWVESKDQDPDGNIRLLQLADVGEGSFRDRSNRFINEEAAGRLGVNFVEPGDVLVARMPKPIGRACIAPNLGQKAITVVDVCILRPGIGVDSRWLMWALNSPATREQIASLATGTTRKRISRKNLATIPVSVPPLPEQRRIVAAIEEHFSRLDAAEAALADAERRTDFLTTTSVNMAFADLVDRAPLGQLAEVRGGIQKQPKRRPKDNHYPFLRVANVKRNQLELADVHEVELFEGEIEKYRLATGDLLVVEGNGSPSQIGRSALWLGEIQDCVHQNHLIRVRAGGDLNPRFLNAFWNSPTNSQQLADVASSTSGLYTLSTSKLNRVEIPLASPEVQTKIADDLDAMQELAEGLRSRLLSARRRSASLRRSILAAAFSGQLAPQDSSDEPASVLLERIAAERAASTPTRKKKKAAS